MSARSGPAGPAGESEAHPAREAHRAVQGLVWQRRRWAVAFTVFLLAVAYAAPAQEIAQGRDRPAALAIAALVAFAGLYIGVIFVVFNQPHRVRVHRALLGALGALTIAVSVGYRGSWSALFVFLAGACVIAVPERWASAGLAVVILTQAGILIGGGGIDRNTPLLFFTFLSGVITLLIRRLRTAVLELHQTREELARVAVAEERLRFARDLHDLLGHTLSLIVVKAEVVRRLVPRDPEAAAREAAEIQDVGRRALAEVREAVTGYRQRGLAAELDSARSALAAAGIEASVREVGTPLPRDTETLVGWAVREGVTNVVRHSRATRCEIDIRRHGEHALVEVRDNGAGATGHGAGGNGLRGLAERMSAAGGCVDAGPRAGGGFRLAVRLPLARAAQDAR